jgi:hypothetical protein
MVRDAIGMPLGDIDSADGFGSAFALLSEVHGSASEAREEDLCYQGAPASLLKRDRSNRRRRVRRTAFGA